MLHLGDLAEKFKLKEVSRLQTFDFDLDAFPEIINGLNPSASVLPVSAKSGEGLDDWFLWIEQILK